MNTSTNTRTAAILTAAAVAAGAALLATAPTAHAAVGFSNPSAAGGVPSEATVTATVQGAGDVYVEYAHARTTYPSVKDRYATDGLIAMWDGDDNQGTGAHDPSATTWVDLTGRHSPMTFTAAPTVGANYYDLSAGGGGTPAQDIAKALNDGKTTIEVVCNVHSLVNDATLFACVDGTDTSTHAAGNRIVWVRHTSGYAVACCEYKETGYHSLCNIDPQFGTVRSYVFEFNADDAPNASKIFVDGAYSQTVSSSEKKKGNAANAWFSLAQRVCAAGASAAISDIRIHCVRVYDRILSADEMVANHAQDMARFFGAASAVDLDHPPRRTTVATNYLGTVGAPVTNAKDFYATAGLLAMWDGEDNQGTGAHVAGATTWKDLTGKHADMTFTAAPTVGANYYDVSAGGGFITDASDIAAALNAEACTVEIVCNPVTIVNDATVFACTDANSPYTRMAYVRSNSGSSAHGVVGAMEYKSTTSYTPYTKFDASVNSIRSYTFAFSSDKCRIFKDGSSTAGGTCDKKTASGDPSTAYFSVGQRVSPASSATSVANMKVYCIRIYNRVLSADEIAANHERDVARFFGANSALPLGSRLVTLADGMKSFVQNDAATFPLSGLRPDVADYTARLFSTGGTPSATFDFSTGSEFEDSAWFDYLDSDAPDKNTGPAVDIGFAMNGKVPVVKTKYQLLANENDRFPFGVSSTSSGTTTSTTAGIFNGTADHNQYRYRVGASGYYADTNVVDLLAVHELELNGPNGTFLNGSLLNADLKNMAEASQLTWGVFARHAADGAAERYQCAKVRIWHFKLWADGTLVRDLVPARKRGSGVGLFDRENGGFHANVGNRDFILGSERPAPQVTDALLSGRNFTATLTREGTADSAVSVAYGVDFGGADTAAWDHFETLPSGFAEGRTSLAVEVSGIDENVRYVRFYSREDGWSETAYLPEVRTMNPFVLIVR